MSDRPAIRGRFVHNIAELREEITAMEKGIVQIEEIVRGYLNDIDRKRSDIASFQQMIEEWSAEQEAELAQGKGAYDCPDCSHLPVFGDDTSWMTCPTCLGRRQVLVGFDEPASKDS